MYLYASMSEYVAHRYLMHSKVKPLDFIFEDHKKHHGAYPSGRFNQSKSKYRFLNLALCIEHGLIFMIPLAIVVAAISPIHAAVIVAFVFIHKKMYSDFHSAMHLRHPIKYMPRKIQELSFWNHFMHHQHPDKFFCVVFPGIDFLVGSTCRMSLEDTLRWEEVKESMGTSNRVDLDYLEIGKTDLCLIPTMIIRKAAGFILGYLEKEFLPEVVIENQDNLPDTPCILIANHGSWKDIFLMKRISKDANLMAATGVTDFMFGLGGYVFNMFLNTYPADKKSIQNSVDFLQNGKDVAIFPEGWAYLDGSTHEFKRGVAVVHDLTKAPVVPIRIVYDYYPKSWIVGLHPYLQYLLSLMMPKYKCRVTMKIGRPVVWSAKRSEFNSIANIDIIHQRKVKMNHRSFMDNLRLRIENRIK